MKKRFRNFETYALVTGAASGMGRIYSLRLAEKGYNVILVDINAKGLEETEALIRSSVQEVKILPIVQDLSALPGIWGPCPNPIHGYTRQWQQLSIRKDRQEW